MYDRAERQFLGFGQVSDEIRGCAADPDPAKKLTNVALSGDCKLNSSPKFLRRAVHTFDTQSIYTSGLQLEETNTDEHANVIDVTSYAYGLSPAPDDEHGTKHLLHPLKACGVDDSNVLNTAELDDLCLKTYRDRVHGDIETWKVNAVDGLGNTANAGRWSVYHLSPNLKLVRKNILEGGANKLRSMALFDHDDLGNVVTMVDFGHIRNPGDTATDDGDNYRSDIRYASLDLDTSAIDGKLKQPLARVPLRDRAQDIVVRQGADYDALARVLRSRSATYKPSEANNGKFIAGRIDTVCELLSPDPQPEETKTDYCKSVANTNLSGDDPFSAQNESKRRAGFRPEDVIVTRVLDYDNSGNPTRTISPFNYRGDWIERRYNYDRDLFRQSASRVEEAHCLSRRSEVTLQTYAAQGGAHGVSYPTVPNDACTFGNGARSRNVQVGAWHVSEAAYDPATGLKSIDVDMNRNATFFKYDGWRRLVSVLSDWDKKESDTPYIDQQVKDHFAEAKTACTGDTTLPCPTTALMHIAYEDQRINVTSPWEALVARYVDRTLYAGDYSQNAAVLEKVDFVDGLGRPVRSAKSADICTEKSLQNTEGLEKGWCSGDEVQSASASGMVERDALGQPLREYFPYPIPVDKVTPSSFGEFARNKYLDWTFVSQSPAGLPSTVYVRDAIGRVTKAVTPDGNATRLAHEIVVGSWGGKTLTRSQTTIVDPRCSVKLYERDARGLITSILEDYGAPHGNTGQVAQGDGGWRTLAKCDDASIAAAAITSAAAAPNTGDRFAETRYEYDALGQMSAVIMSRVRGEETARISFGYDNLGRRIRVSDPDRGVEDIEIDGMGNVRSWNYSPRRRAASGNTKTVLQEFDANRLVEISPSGHAGPRCRLPI